MTKKKTVAISILGVKLDSGRRLNRWERWRPTVSLFQHEDLLVDRLELIREDAHSSLADFIAKDVESVSPETEIHQRAVDWGGDPWDFEKVFDTLLDFAQGYHFQPDKEDYLIHITTGTHVAQICLFLLTETRHLPGRLIQTSPANKQEDALGKFQIIDLDLGRYDHIAQRFAAQKSDAVSFLKSGIETQDAAFNTLIERIEHVSIQADDPILLTGPTGAGKSQLARRIYELKHSRHQVEGKFVELNCATLRGDQAMSTLFGHLKGAFTGAEKARPGLLKAADKGILFLDEIGELGADEQAMLLRAVEERTFLPAGSDTEVKSDFQLIAGTNRNLSKDVADGKFRSDLLARINLWHFQLPGLKERPSDIEPNLDYELERYASKTGRRVTINRESRKLFLEYAISPAAQWRGNFRDLNAAVTRMATLAESGRITTQVAKEERERLKATWQEESSGDFPCVREVLGGEMLEELDLFDLSQLESVLKICRKSKNLSEAGRQLFAVSRQGKGKPNDADRLRKYLLKYGLGWKDVQGAC